MNKQEAANYLGISERSLARYASQGKIQVTYTKGTRGHVAIFDDKDLEQLKQELSAPQATKLANIAHDKLIPRSPDNLANPPLASFVQVLEMLSNNMQPRMTLEHKLFLTIPEAEMYSGISKHTLKKEIRAGRLNASSKLGRGYRIKRSDLESYAKKL